MSKEWHVYIIRCGDGSFYTGISTDVPRRLAEHQDSDKGAKYLRGRQPLELVYQVAVSDHSTAARLEYKIKQLSPAQKQQLISQQPSLSTLITQLQL